MNDELKKFVQGELEQMIVKVSLPTDFDIEAGFRGTGFFITTDGYILTAWHCIKDFFQFGNDILIECCDGEVFPGQLDQEKSVEKLDIAVIKIDHHIDKCIPLLKHVSKSYKGDEVVSTCYSEMYKSQANCFSGKISLVDAYNFISTNVIQGPGQSGDPAYHYGVNRIIGVVTNTYNADKLRNAGLTAKLDFLFSKWKELFDMNDGIAKSWDERLETFTAKIEVPSTKSTELKTEVNPNIKAKKIGKVFTIGNVTDVKELKMG